MDLKKPFDILMPESKVNLTALDICQLGANTQRQVGRLVEGLHNLLSCSCSRPTLCPIWAVITSLSELRHYYQRKIMQHTIKMTSGFVVSSSPAYVILYHLPLLVFDFFCDPFFVFTFFFVFDLGFPFPLLFFKRLKISSSLLFMA